MNELIQRLDNIFAGLLGCRLEFAPIDSLSREQWKNDDLESYLLNLGSAPSCIHDASEQRLGFPVRQSGLFAGLVVVNGWQGVDKTRLHEMADLVTSLMERALGNQEKQAVLRASEEQLEIARGHSNVIPLRFTRAPLSLIAARNMVNDFQKTQTSASVTSFLLQYKTGYPIRRAAFETHSRCAGRIAFLDLCDLPADLFSSRENVQKLGAVSIFIEDVTTLSLETQTMIVEYLATLPSMEMPLLFIGALDNPEKLIEEGRLQAALRDKLAFMDLPWNPQDTDSAVVRTCVRMLLEGEPAERITAQTKFVPFNATMLDTDNPSFH